MAEPVRLDRLFAAQAAATPDAVAVLFRGGSLSYGELAARVGRLAAELRGHGVGPGVVVALCLTRTAAMIAVLLAVLEAGGAYLPLDPRYPAERMAFVLADSRAALLIADVASVAWASFAGTVLELVGEQLVQRAYGQGPTASAPADLAYVIYTSGSTGAPKGVMLGHGASHLIAWAREAYAEGERARVAATTSLCFDPSILEIFAPLCTGGALILKANALEPFAPDEQPTLLDTVPSVLAELCRAGALPASLRVLNVGGEALSAGLVRQVQAARPGLALYNHYGPTEATTVATVAAIPPDMTGEPPIGRPVRGARIVLLDPGGAPMAEGETGEIHIGGPGLALGYLHRPELTAERFVTGTHGRLYRTGDLAVWRDGQLHFAGRTDSQVKVRGVRVELGEIETALLRIPGVARALAMVRDRAGRAEIVAYVEASASVTESVTGEAVRQALADWLPPAMLPGQIVVMAALPVLVSGKIDRGALPEPEPAGAAVEDEPGATAYGERPILHVFQEVLGRRVGPDDSFFDLGGDSLSSVRAALRLEEVLGHEVPAALLHQAPTPRGLAKALQHARLRADGHASLLQAGGPDTPLFCVADLFGHPFNYLSLARRLGDERPVWGLSPGPLQEAFVRDGDVGALTRGFRAELRRIQPQGPYRIAGYSAGGMLAFDLACALEAEGEEVRLILLDASLHSARPPLRATAHWALQQARGLLHWRRPGPRSRRPTRLTPPSWIPASQVAFAARLMRAGTRYRPGRFAGPVLIIKAQERAAVDQLLDLDGRLGWSAALTGEVACATVPGGHHPFMRDPAVAETAAVVRRFLASGG